MVLIETLWNVKQWMKLKSYANSSINRNIVECKEMSGFDVSDNAICINRNIVECKEVNYHIEKEFDSVLIETLWNVKKEQQKAAQDMTLVLIETLWNVKVLIQLSIYKIRSVVLIETLWNVKFLTQHLSRLGRVRINRNIVECKERHI